MSDSSTDLVLREKHLCGSFLSMPNLQGIDESNLLHRWEITSTHEDTPPVAPAPGRGFRQSLSSESQTSHPVPAGLVAGSRLTTRGIISWNFLANEDMDPDASFPAPLLHVPGVSTKPKEEMRVPAAGGKHEAVLHRGATTVNAQAQEHIIAERNRREKLNQKFIALSAIIPGLKKADKASVLGDAVRYVKELEARVKALEDQNVKRTVESVVLVKKSQPSAADADADDDGSSSDENFDAQPSQKPFPEIEAKVSGKTVLMRIHCENRKGVIVKILSEIESINLTIINTNVMPFLGSSINVTVTAQIEEEFSMTVKDLVRKLGSALS
nr:PREDICTED: transcription factor bHLH18 isoform X1 [Musa acuminata subsp. malaccensis]